jgi:hypothetical protein
MSNAFEIYSPQLAGEPQSNTGNLLKETMALVDSFRDRQASTAFLPSADQLLQSQLATQTDSKISQATSTPQPGFDGAYTGTSPTSNGFAVSNRDAIETMEVGHYGRGDLGNVLAQVAGGVASYQINRAIYGRNSYNPGYYNPGYNPGYYNQGFCNSGYPGSFQSNRFGYTNGWPVNQNAYYGHNAWNGYNVYNNGNYYNNYNNGYNRYPVGGTVAALAIGSLINSAINNNHHHHNHYNHNHYRPNYNLQHNHNHYRPNYNHHHNHNHYRPNYNNHHNHNHYRPNYNHHYNHRTRR